jgi:hypothetical protein
VIPDVAVLTVAVFANAIVFLLLQVVRVPVSHVVVLQLDHALRALHVWTILLITVILEGVALIVAVFANATRVQAQFLMAVKVMLKRVVA